MANRQCSGMAAGTQNRCSSGSDSRIAAERTQEITMCRHGSTVSTDVCCSTQRQLWELNQTMDSINDILGQLLLEIRQQNSRE